MRLGRLLRPLDRRFARLHEEIRYTQAIAARAYETALDWPGELERVRSGADYDAAYEETEPLVTVRIATYNRADELLDRSLRSVFTQTYENWEAVIVGDACTDDTTDRVNALRDERVRFVNLPYRGPYPEGPKARWRVSGYNAKNHGLRLSRGRWIAPLDDDDEFDPDHIEVLLDHARRERAELAYGNLRVVDAKTGSPDTELPTLGTWPPRPGRFNFLASIYHGALKRFEYDYNCHLYGEVDDTNLMRRLWQAGVRFSFLDRPVGTYYYARRSWP